jgi:hypothetical protein
VLTLALAGCSTLRLGYDQGPSLARWWIDGYLDLAEEQKPLVRDALVQWFSWHRRTQLGDYANLMARAQREVLETATPEQVCRWTAEVRQRLETAVDNAVPLAAGLVPRLQADQIRHLEARFAKKNADYRKDYLQPKPQDRLEAAVDRAIDRAQTLYGRLDAEQKRLLEAGLQARPGDAEAWYAHRLAHQRDVLATLRSLQADPADKADAARTVATLRAWQQRWMAASRAEGASGSQRMMQVGCELAARLHNTTTPAQRQHARERLKGWEDDLRHLAAKP